MTAPSPHTAPPARPAPAPVSRRASSDQALEWMRSVLAHVSPGANGAAWAAEQPAKEGCRILSFVNAHGFNLAAKDPAFAHALCASDHLLRDGSGMKLLMRLCGRAPGANLNGTDLIPQLIDAYAAAGQPVALLGTREPWLGQAAEAAGARGARVVLSADGFQDDSAYARLLQDAPEPPRLVVLAMGMPKQERVALLLREALRARGTGPCLIVNGGAVLDFLGGKVSRAPLWMRRAGIEWVFRLLSEPQRMWRRYLLGNGVFLRRALRLRFSRAR